MESGDGKPYAAGVSGLATALTTPTEQAARGLKKMRAARDAVVLCGIDVLGSRA